MSRKRDWKQISDAQGKDSVKHEWTQAQAQESSSSSGVKTEAKEEEQESQEVKKSRPKSHRPIPTDGELETARGMKFGFGRAVDEVNKFLVRYFVRPMKNGEDYKYIIRPHPYGHICSLTVGVWSNDVYGGVPCSHYKQAQNEAAKAFLSDPAVVEAAAYLPPTVAAVRQYFNKKMIFEQEEHVPISQRKPEVEKRVHEYISECLQNGCRNAFTDGRA
eukprot:s2998_g6.t1